MITIPYTEDFMPDTSKKIFANLWNTMEWERRQDAPRNECWMNDYGTPYTYGSGRGIRTYQSKEWNPIVRSIRLAIHVKTRIYYDACFVNGYLNARDHIGWHSDDSPEINPYKPIAVVSFGSTRDFLYREIGTENITRISLGPGSLLIMPAGFQQKYEHKLPKAGYMCDKRLSLTFRCLVKV